MEHVRLHCCLLFFGKVCLCVSYVCACVCQCVYSEKYIIKLLYVLINLAIVLKGKSIYYKKKGKFIFVAQSICWLLESFFQHLRYTLLCLN